MNALAPYLARADASWSPMARVGLVGSPWGETPNSKLSDGGTEDQSMTEEANRRSLKRSVSP
jgi:hypothetical protein